MPYGVAVARDGTVYVSDYLGQRIRAVDASEIVRTVAGGGPLEPNGLEVRGGYADGAGGDARFNGPKGIALDRSGRLFVADSKNQCIRIVDGGIVSTSRERRGAAETTGSSKP
jgi:sugar lactone lactonase YvrE